MCGMVLRLTLCAVLQQGLGHLVPQRAALAWELPCNLQALGRTSPVQYDGVDHRQVIPKWNGRVQAVFPEAADSIKRQAHLRMRSEETLWLLTGVNLTLSDLTSPGSRRRLYTYGLVEPSTNPELLFSRNDCETNQQPVRGEELPQC